MRNWSIWWIFYSVQIVRKRRDADSVCIKTRAKNGDRNVQSVPHIGVNHAGALLLIYVMIASEYFVMIAWNSNDIKESSNAMTVNHSGRGTVQLPTSAQIVAVVDRRLDSAVNAVSDFVNSATPFVSIVMNVKKWSVKIAVK